MLKNNLPFKNRVQLKHFSSEEVRRFDEVAFYVTVNQMLNSKVISSTPMGTTVPKMLAILLNKNPDLIDYAYSILTLPANTPTTDEICLTHKAKHVSAAKSMYTPETFYKGLKRYLKAGQPTLVPKLSNIQTKHVRAFNRDYAKAFFGKRTSTVGLLK